MNIRLQKYKKNRLAGMNIYNAARAAGYSHNYANKCGKRIEILGIVGMKEAFEQAGLTDKTIIAHALKGLEATKELIIDGKKIGDLPEWTVRHKYFETIMKMTGRFNIDLARDKGGDLVLKKVVQNITISQKEKSVEPVNRVGNLVIA